MIKKNDPTATGFAHIPKYISPLCMIITPHVCSLNPNHPPTIVAQKMFWRYVGIWRFPKIGVPPNHPFSSMDFP